MSTLADFYDLLLPEVPGCTTAMMDLQLRETARQFCHQTGAWRVPFTAVDLVAAQAAYTLIPGVANSEVVKITKLTVNSELLWADTEREQQGRDAVEPKYVRNEPPFTLSLELTQITLMADEVPAAAVVGGLLVEGALKPTATAATLPDFLKSQYSDAMRYGTLARLMVMAKKPWTDRALATAYLGEWHKALNFAAYQVQVGHTRERLRVKQWG